MHRDPDDVGFGVRRGAMKGGRRRVVGFVG